MSDAATKDRARLSTCQSTRRSDAALAWLRSALLIALLLVSQLQPVIASVNAFADACALGHPASSCPCQRAPIAKAPPACPLCDHAEANTPAPTAPTTHLCCGCCARDSTPLDSGTDPARLRASTPDRPALHVHDAPSLAATAAAILTPASYRCLTSHWLTRDGLTHARLCRWTT